MSVQQIIDLQNENAALRRELAERRRCCRCGCPEMRVPDSYHAVEAFMSADEVVVLDDVDSDDETHCCDAMGCGSLGNHVVERLIRNTRPADAVRVKGEKFLRAAEAYHDAVKLRDDVENSHMWSRELRVMYDAMVGFRAALAQDGRG